MDKNKIKLNVPADDWMNAFMMGNGRIGAAVYGAVNKERIDLSHITFFSGNASLDNNQRKASDAFYKMRELVSEGKYDEAKKASNGFIGKRLNYGTNLPVGQLIIDFISDSYKGVYERSLDFINGIVDVKTNNINREAFISDNENMLFYCVKSEDANLISCKAGFMGYGENWSVENVQGRQYFKASAREDIHSDGTTGVEIKGRIFVHDTDGEIINDDGKIMVKNASMIVFALDMHTDYMVESLDDVEFTDVDDVSYDIIKEMHMKEFSSYMKRVSFSLERNNEKTEKMFQYGRYLLLSSSRESSPAPAHLQGIWNDNVACKIGWTCDMHLDINTQMNYWLSLAGNLKECNKPLFDWTENSLIPSGRITAKKSFGLDGWAAELVSNLWGFTAPYWSSNISPCPTSGIWLISQYWEYYLYTQDKEFLKNRALNVIREAVEFFAEYVFASGQYYSTGPSISPENSFKIGKQKHYFSNGSTYEILMIRELFDQFIKASDELMIKDSLYNKVKEIYAKLIPYRTLDDGTLAEWQHDFPAADAQHRHTSHLLGVFPYSQITPEKTPELAKTVEKSIEAKLSPYENWEDTGWARSLLALYSARLGSKDGAGFHINAIQDNLTSDALLVMHPPTRGAGSFKEVYELDGNTGFSMSVIEMLIQSHDGIIKLLPALPDTWREGYISGIVARGNIIVDLSWRDTKLKIAKLLSNVDKDITISYQGKVENLSLVAGKPRILEI